MLEQLIDMMGLYDPDRISFGELKYVIRRRDTNEMEYVFVFEENVIRIEKSLMYDENNEIREKILNDVMNHEYPIRKARWIESEIDGIYDAFSVFEKPETEFDVVYVRDGFKDELVANQI